MSNAEWQPLTGKIHGVDMALVPPGCFTMGADRIHTAQPEHEQCFDQPFLIDRFEVINQHFDSSGAFTGKQKPRVNVNWFEAREYCISRGARLATVREWEYAARGPDSLIYPWGNEFVSDNAVWDGNSDRGNGIETWEIGSRPAGISWVGAHDMSGNVAEWMNTIFNREEFPYPYIADDGRENAERTGVFRAVRGGSFNMTRGLMQVANPLRSPDDNASEVIGLRCVSDIQ